MATPNGLPSDDSTQEGLGRSIDGTQQFNDGDSLEPSHIGLQSQNPPGWLTRETDKAHAPVGPGEMTKLEAHKDDNSTSSSSSIAEEGRMGNPGRQSPTNSLKVKSSVSIVRDDIEIPQEVELRKSLEKTSTAPQIADPNLVTWAADDPDNPKTWSARLKWTCVAIVSIFTFISPVSSSMTAPALDSIGAELNMQSDLEKNMSLSVFILAYAIGPLLLGPLSELYGRVIVLQCGNLFYLVFNLGCGLCRTSSQLIAFRFLSGFGGSAPLAIGGGVLGDLFTAEERGRALSLYTLGPLLGPAVGPIAGAFISENISWRWIFFVTTIADGLIQIAGLFLLRECYAPVILRWRKEKLIKETGNQALYTNYDDASKTVRATLTTAMVRPFRMLFTQPIIQVLALYMMYLYGLMYLVLSTFPVLWKSYGFSTGIGGLHYIALGLGFLLGAQICAPLQDRIYARLKKRYGVTVGRPEFRIPMMAPAAILMPAGLVMYGWTAQYRTPWILPDIGVAILTMGTIIGFQCIQGFLVDTYTRYAASAVAAVTVLRSLAGFVFPLFAPSLYARLEYGWGNTLLAFVGVAIGWPGPILLSRKWKYGQVLRERSPFAAGD